MSISCDCVRLGPGWWQDLYFGWYFVYDPPLVARSLAGDHSWVPEFLESVRPEAKPPTPDLPRKAHRLQPPGGRPCHNIGEVLKRLRDEFGFFAAHPSQVSDDVRASIAKLLTQNAEPDLIDAAVAGRDCAFSVIASDSGETTDYLSFQVRHGEGILIVYHNEQHQSAVRSLVERCAGCLAYEVILQESTGDGAK
jgi:hypothetical protein